MWSVFEANLSSEQDDAELLDAIQVEKKQDDGGYHDWHLERKVKIPRQDDWDEGELGDSCCFGTRTVEFGLDYVWKLHSGV